MIKVCIVYITFSMLAIVAQNLCKLAAFLHLREEKKRKKNPEPIYLYQLILTYC